MAWGPQSARSLSLLSARSSGRRGRKAVGHSAWSFFALELLLCCKVALDLWGGPAFHP